MAAPRARGFQVLLSYRDKEPAGTERLALGNQRVPFECADCLGDPLFLQDPILTSK